MLNLDTHIVVHALAGNLTPAERRLLESNTRGNFSDCSSGTGETISTRAHRADELIAATSIVHGAALVTRDKKIRRSKVVPLAR